MTLPAPSSPAARPKAMLGPVLMMGAVGSFALMVMCVKLAGSELTSMELVFWRSWIAVPLALLIALQPGGLGPGGQAPEHDHLAARLRIEARGWMLLRATLGFGAMLCFYTAAKALSVADLNLVGRLQPILIALVAPLMLGRGERADGTTWGVLGAGLLGCAILIGPQLQVGQVGGLWALGAILFSSGAHTTLRRLGATERPASVVFWFQVVVMVYSFLSLWLLPGPGLRWPPGDTVLWIVGIGAFATLGQTLMTRAYQADKAATVAAASHVGPLWGVAIDLLVFGVWPGPTTLLGGGIVMAAVLWLVLGPRSAAPPEARRRDGPEAPPRL